MTRLTAEDFDSEGNLRNPKEIITDNLQVPLQFADSNTVSNNTGTRSHVQLLDAGSHRPGFRSPTTTGMSDSELKAVKAAKDKRAHSYATYDFIARNSYLGTDPDLLDGLYDADPDDDLDREDQDGDLYGAGERGVNSKLTGYGERGQGGPQLGDRCTVRSGRGRFGDEGAAGTIVEADGALCCLANNLIPLDQQRQRVLKGLVWQPNDSRNDSSGRKVHVDGIGDVVGPGDSRTAARPFIGSSNPALQKAYDTYDFELANAYKKGGAG
jgi:hypothetical protein